jgi:hypothetical protein
MINNLLKSSLYPINLKNPLPYRLVNRFLMCDKNFLYSFEFYFYSYSIVLISSLVINPNSGYLSISS